MAEDPKSWLGANAFYTGSDLSMACPRMDTYVITTKQARFVDALLQHKGESTQLDRGQVDKACTWEGSKPWPLRIGLLFTRGMG